jgi:biopolymer transport protein ExbD
LEALCRQYWHPVYAVARRAGHDVETAKDLTQGFFARMLEKGWLEAADQEKGRFRTYLVTALKLANKDAVAVVVHAEEKVPFQQVKAILDTCKAAGISAVSLATP